MSQKLAWIVVPVGVVVASVVSASSVADSDLPDEPTESTAATSTRTPASARPSPFLGGEAPDPSKTAADDDLAEAGTHFAPVRGSTPLETFFASLRRAERPERSERVSIVQLGDSHTAGDAFSGQLRRVLQQSFGDAGRGLAHPGRPWPSFRQENMSWDMSRGWTPRLATGNHSGRPLGLGGVRLDTHGPGAWVERGTCEHCEVGRRFDTYAVHYLRQPGGGELRISVDGREVRTRSTAGPRGLGIVRGSVGSGAHTLRVRAAGGGPVSLLGIRTTSGQNGVEYASLGLNGATAGDFAATGLAGAQLRRLNPDLVVFAFGTNSAYNLFRFAEKYADNPKAVLHQKRRWARRYRSLVSETMKRAGEASCLIMTPPDLAAGSCRWRPDAAPSAPACVRRPPTFDFVVGVQRHVAETLGCATWSQSEAMGGPGSIDRWADLDPRLAQRDGKHLTFEGYKRLGSQLNADLMRAYRAWRDGRPPQFQTRPVHIQPSPQRAAR